MEQLRLAVERAESGHGQVVAVVGEAGVGKSRLYWEFSHSRRTDGGSALSGHRTTEVHMFPRWGGINFVVLTAIALLLAACQTGSVSVEEARRIATQAVDVPFVPPPPTIDDVLALLEEGPAPEWRERVVADQAFAARPGSTARADEGNAFLYKRGAKALGLTIPQSLLLRADQVIE